MIRAGKFADRGLGSSVMAVVLGSLAAFFLSVTFSWDAFIIAFLLACFDVTLPVEIWNMLRSELNPKSNAIGSVVFLISIAPVLILEFTEFRRQK